MIIMGIFHINLDGILGLAVSGLIIYSATGMIKEVLEPIIGIIDKTFTINNPNIINK